MSLFEIWQLSTNKQIKNKIIQLLNISFYSDPTLMQLLIQNTNLAAELCYSIKQDISLSGLYTLKLLAYKIRYHNKILILDQVSLGKSLICLNFMLANTSKLPLQFNGIVLIFFILS